MSPQPRPQSFLQLRFDKRQYALHHPVHPVGIRMHAVAKQKLRLRRDAIEEERIERQAVFARQLRVDRIERVGIIRPQIWGREHAHQENIDLTLPQLCDHFVQVGAGDRRRNPAQHVIGAELQNHQVGIVRHRPVEALQAAGRCIARHTGARDHDIVTFPLQGLFKLFREGLSRRKAVTGHQTVAKCNDFGRFGRIRGRMRQNRQHCCKKQDGETFEHVRFQPI